MRFLIAILTLVMLAGCGSKGPLYLPEEQPDGSDATAPASAGPNLTSADDEEEEKKQ